MRHDRVAWMLNCTFPEIHSPRVVSTFNMARRMRQAAYPRTATGPKRKGSRLAPLHEDHFGDKALVRW